MKIFIEMTEAMLDFELPEGLELVRLTQTIHPFIKPSIPPSVYHLGIADTHSMEFFHHCTRTRIIKP